LPVWRRRDYLETQQNNSEMNIKTILVLLITVASALSIRAQISTSEQDSLYILEIEKKKSPSKVLHAEPLYIDLIRDLGARKGEKEWNVGLGLNDKLQFDSYEALIEYEWAPIDRLGLEIEVPFTFYSPIRDTPRDSIPANRVNSLKLAGQWSFFVNDRLSTSMAIGYINEFELSDFRNFGQPFIKANVYNPFFIVAKRWGSNWHSLIYTGPIIEQEFETGQFHQSYEINTNFHFMIPGTRNFIGLEINKIVDQGLWEATLRPQMRVGIADNLLIGIVAGIPINRERERLSSFVRLIWEPGHKN
jgi:hypothetical protein